MITFKAQHILNPAAKKRTFWRNFRPRLQLQMFPKRPDQYDQHILNIAGKKRTLWRYNIYLNSEAKKWTFWQNFKPQLQLQIIPKRPDQYDHLQGSTYTKS